MSVAQYRQTCRALKTSGQVVLVPRRFFHVHPPIPFSSEMCTLGPALSVMKMKQASICLPTLVFQAVLPSKEPEALHPCFPLSFSAGSLGSQVTIIAQNFDYVRAETGLRTPRQNDQRAFDPSRTGSMVHAGRIRTKTGPSQMHVSIHMPRPSIHMPHTTALFAQTQHHIRHIPFTQFAE